MKGQLIVLEGTDGSGKSTQKDLLIKKLTEKRVDFRTVTFPRYSHESSALVRMYLGGEFGSDPDSVPAKTASVLYAVDRYASFKKDWEDYYRNGGIIVCDRYTTSNAVHQTPKLPEGEWFDFTDWLFDFEYSVMGIPAPDMVLFLDMPTEYSLSLIEKRQGDKGDIHEKDHEYLARCRKCALKICEKYGWKKISCVENGRIKAAEEISNDIAKLVLERIGI